MMDYSKILGQKIQSVKPSGIRKFFDLVEKSKNGDIISLTIGEPDFVTPWHIRKAGIDSLNDGKTYYTANSGLIDLRNEISKYLTRRFDFDTYDPNSEILVTVGGSEAIDLAIRTIVEEGDEVIIPEPSFVCYNPITVMSGGVPKMVTTLAKDEFRITAQQIKDNITPKTKLIVLPFPNNPTGAVLCKHDLEEIAEVLRGTDILVLTDEIYAELTYGEKHFSILNIADMRERTILVNGFSKCFAMTGWRLGYACGPAAIIGAMTKMHQFGIMSAPTMAQYAAIEALKNGDSDIEMMKDEYDTRRRVLLSEFKRLEIPCFDARGAFYVFPYIGKFGMSSEDFCEKLFVAENVAIVPGSAFGDSGEGYARICYAYSLKKIEEAIMRIERFISTIR